jgi:hypothetical protein
MMNVLLKWLPGVALAGIAGALPGVATADDAASLMKSRLGTTEASSVIADAFARAGTARQGSGVLEQ